MKPLELLLENYWFVKDQDEENYNKIKTELDEPTQKFIKEKLRIQTNSKPIPNKTRKNPWKTTKFHGLTRIHRQNRIRISMPNTNIPRNKIKKRPIHPIRPNRLYPKPTSRHRHERYNNRLQLIHPKKINGKSLKIYQRTRIHKNI